MNTINFALSTPFFPFILIEQKWSAYKTSLTKMLNEINSFPKL